MYLLYDIQVKEEISSGSFKPNCALVVLDFLIRHGYVTADNGEKGLTF